MKAFILSLNSSFVVSGSTTDSNKIYLVVSYILHHSFFHSLSSDRTACLRRSASKTKCTVNGAMVRVDRKKSVLGRVRLRTAFTRPDPTRPDPTRPDPTRPDPTLSRLITPPLLSCRVPFLSVLQNKHLEKTGENNRN